MRHLTIYLEPELLDKYEYHCKRNKTEPKEKSIHLIKQYVDDMEQKRDMEESL